MLKEKQIKALEELTGIPVLKEKIEVDQITFEKTTDDKGSYEMLKINLDSAKELVIYYAVKSSWGSGSYTDQSIPVKGLGPLAKILEEE